MREQSGASRLEIGISLPAASGTVEPGSIEDAARYVEDLGFESVWSSDLIIGDGTPSLESVVVLATAAAATERIRLGFGVLVLPLRPVPWVAAQIQTLQHVSGGRIILGVGSGGFAGTPFWRSVGVPGRGRGRRTDAALDVLPQLITGEPTRLEEVREQPSLALGPPAPAPPILIGGNSEVAIQRAVTRGDGWFPSLIAPDALASGAAKLREIAAERGRATPSITVGGHALPGNKASVRPALDALMGSLLGDHGMTPEEAAEIPITGTPSEVAERFAAYADAGVERLVLSLDGGGWKRRCELIAEAHALLN